MIFLGVVLLIVGVFFSRLLVYVGLALILLGVLLAASGNAYY